MAPGGEAPETQQPRAYKWWQYQPSRARRRPQHQPARLAPRLADMRPGNFFGALFLVVAVAVIVGVLAAFWITDLVVTQRYQVLPPAPSTAPFPTFSIP